MIIIYLLILLIISNGIGKIILKKEHKFYNLRIIIGFFCFIFFLQFLYYPFQYFHLSSKYIHLINFGVIILTLIYGLFKVEKKDLEFMKNPYIFLLVFIIFFLVKILPLTEAGDDWFYMPLIMENANTNSINSINPRTGWDGKLTNIYNFQGYYLLISSIYKIENYIKSDITSILISFKTLFTSLFIIFSGILLLNFKKMYNDINKRFYLITSMLSILLVGVLEWSHIYWGSFVLFPVVIPCYLLFFDKYSNSPNKKDAFILSLITGSALALASSSLFLFAFLIFSFGIYNLKYKNMHFEDYYIISAPLFIYLSFFLNAPYLLIFVIIMFVVSQKYQDKINNIIKLFNYKYLFLLIIIFIVLGLILELDFSWEIYRLSKKNFIFNSVICIYIYIYYIFGKRKKISPILYSFFIFNILFFNPLTAPFVSNFLTTNLVYYRLFYITKNPIIITTIFISLYQNHKNNIIIKHGIELFVIILLCFYSVIFIKNTILSDNYYTKYNYYYRNDVDSLKVMNFLQNNTKQKNKTKILGIYFSPRQYSLNYYSDVYRYPYDPSLNDEYIIKLFKNEKVTNEEYIEFKNKVQLKGYEFIIMTKVISPDDLAFSNLVYENNSFVVYKVNIEGDNK